MSKSDASDFEKVSIPFRDVTSDLVADLSDAGGRMPEIRNPKGRVDISPTVITSTSSVLETTDFRIQKPDTHSVPCELTAIARRYKITLAQARQIVENEIRKAEAREQEELGHGTETGV